MMRIGSKGPEVESLQLWLVGHGLLTLVDGSYGPKTEQAVRDMQVRVGARADGIVGDATRLAFARAGWLTEPSAFELPPVPNFSPLNSAGRQRVWGEIIAVPLANGSDVRITNGWQSTHLTSVIVPQLAGVPGAQKDGRIFWHRQAVDSLLGLFSDIEAAGLLPLILSWGGSWVPRFVRGSTTTLSAHSHGTAFDINVAWNQLGAAPAKRGQRGSVVELVPLAANRGYYWGGWLATRPDGQHFECARPDR